MAGKEQKKISGHPNMQFFGDDNNSNIDDDIDGNWGLGDSQEEEIEVPSDSRLESKIIQLIFYQYQNVYSKDELLSLQKPTICTSETLSSLIDLYSRESLLPVNNDQKSLLLFEEVSDTSIIS